ARKPAEALHHYRTTAVPLHRELPGARSPGPWQTTPAPLPRALGRSGRSSAFGAHSRRQTHRTPRTLSAPTAKRTTAASWAPVLPSQDLSPGTSRRHFPSLAWLPTVRTEQLCTFRFSLINSTLELRS